MVNFKSFLKNPLSIFFLRLVKNSILEWKFRQKNLKIGYLSIINDIKVGKYNTIYDGVVLNGVELGDFTYIASNTSISNTKIGKFCSIGPDCRISLPKHPSSIFVSTHPIFFSTLKQSQISFSDKNYFDEFGKPIIIGNDVWIGANVIIINGIKVGDGAIIGAGSVVTKDVPPYSIVGGVPAKIIRYRFEKEEIKKLLQIKWWEWDIEKIKENYLKFHDVKNFINEY